VALALKLAVILYQVSQKDLAYGGFLRGEVRSREYDP
jgi:hypothetical protein